MARLRRDAERVETDLDRRMQWWRARGEERARQKAASDEMSRRDLAARLAREEADRIAQERRNNR
jgi:hypothetical protein